MLDKAESSFRDIISTLQIAKLYTTAHPTFEKYLDKAYIGLEEILKDREEFIIGIVGEEMVFEKEIFFDLSKAVRPTIMYMKERGVERIVIRSGLQKEELVKFVDFLMLRKEDSPKQPHEYLLVKGVKNIAVGKIEGAAQLFKNDKGLGGFYDNTAAEVLRDIDAVMNSKTIDFINMKFALANIADSFLTQYKEFMKLTVVKRYDVNTFMHILNVAILSMYFASKLGFKREEVLNVGIAGLFHDIGKLYISRKIIKKTDKLTDAEFEEMKSHVFIGAELLLKYVDSAGVMPVVVAFEHHLKYNLKGYPKLYFPQQPSVATSIVSICDVYDALSQKRSYKRDYPPDVIYKLMINEKGQAFDSELLERFFGIMGVWPIGSIVALNDGSVAVVREENEDKIFLPKVEVLAPEEKKGLIDLSQEQGGPKIEKFLNPFTEAKEYIHLI